MSTVTSKPSSPLPTWDQVETPIAELEGYGLSVKTIGILEGVGLLYIVDLITKHPQDLLNLPNFGHLCLNELQKSLERWNSEQARQREDEWLAEMGRVAK